MKNLILLFVLFTFNGYSQNSFEKIIELPGREIGGNVIELEDGYLISGLSRGQNNSISRIILTKIDRKGNTIWLKYLEGSENSYQLNYLSKATDGGFLLCCTESNKETNIYRTDKSGNYVWKTSLHETPYSENGKSVIQINDSSIICIGGDEFGTAIYRLDKNGLKKDFKYLDSIIANEIIKYDDHSVALIGTRIIGEFNSDIYYSVYNDKLEPIKERLYGGPGQDIGISITNDKNGDFYILGYYDYQIPDYGNGILTLKINSDCDTIWHHTLDWILVPRHIDVDSNLNCYFSTGLIQNNEIGIVKIDSAAQFSWYRSYSGITQYGNNFSYTSDCGFILVGHENEDLKILKLNCDGKILSTFYEPHLPVGIITISPNPFVNETTLRSNEAFRDATITIYNSMGQSVRQMKNISQEAITIQRDNLPADVYFIRLSQANKFSLTDKMIITD